MNSDGHTTDKDLNSNMSETPTTETHLTKNHNQMTDEHSLTEEQIAREICTALNERSERLTATQAKRLSQARELAVQKLSLRNAQSVKANGNVLQWLGHHMGDYFGHHRAMSTVMIAGIMILAFFAAQQFDFNNNLEHSDAFLLASELPPEAFADKGFDTWLDSKVSY